MSRKTSTQTATKTRPAQPSILSLKIDVMLAEQEVKHLTSLGEGREDMLMDAQTFLEQARKALREALESRETR